MAWHKYKNGPGSYYKGYAPIEGKFYIIPDRKHQKWVAKQKKLKAKAKRKVKARMISKPKAKRKTTTSSLPYFYPSQNHNPKEKFSLRLLLWILFFFFIAIKVCFKEGIIISGILLIIAAILTVVYYCYVKWRDKQ